MVGERILGTQRISWNPRGEVISLMRDEEAALSLSLLLSSILFFSFLSFWEVIASGLCFNVCVSLILLLQQISFSAAPRM